MQHDCRNILIVDDDAAVRRLLRGLLQSEYPRSQNTPSSIKAFGNGDLSLAKSRDFGRGDASERPIPAGQSPVRQRIIAAGAEIGYLAAVFELLSGVGGQAAFRQ